MENIKWGTFEFDYTVMGSIFKGLMKSANVLGYVIM